MLNGVERWLLKMICCVGSGLKDGLTL